MSRRSGFFLGGASSNYIRPLQGLSESVCCLQPATVWLHGLTRIWQSRGQKSRYVKIKLPGTCLSSFWWLNPPKQGLFQSKQGSFGFQVYQLLSIFHGFHWTCLGTLLQMPLLTSEGLLLMILRRSQGRPSHPYPNCCSKHSLCPDVSK